MKRALLAALLSLALVGPLRAQESADEAKKDAVLEEARQHVARAKMHYDLGEFKEAADEYILVYRLRPIAALLFNIAQAYRQGGLYDKARQFYKSYLREAPEAKNRVTIEQAIREMDELVAKEKRAKEKPPDGVKQPPDTVLPMKQPPQVATTPPPPPAKEQPKATPPAQVAATPASPPVAPPARDAATQPHPATTAVPTAPTPSSPPAGTKVALAPVRTEPPPAAARAPPATFRASPTLAPPPRERTWTWVVAGASVVALGGGAVFGYKTIHGASPSDASTANILYGAGAVLAIASAALFVFEF
jgi:tetratricopeptide (TPR) repeat protein